MKHLLVLLCLLGHTWFALAQTFPVTDIPAALREEADAVVRHASHTLVVENEEHATLYVEEAITILTPQGEDFAIWQAYYDAFRDIKSVKAEVYDAQGRRIAKAKRKDIRDLGLGGDGISDGRRQVLDLRQRRHPYTVHWEYELRFEGLLHLPEWRPQSAPRLSVLYSELTVRFPADNPVRQRSLGLSAPDTSGNGESQQYHWAIEQQPPIYPVEDGPRFSLLQPRVLLAPTRFEMDGYAGDMTTWRGMGHWQAQLLADRAALPSDVVQTVRTFVADAPTRRDTLRRLYQYMQGRTRYVSIQLGIGGWQPFPAEVVHDKQYGDCKALSNYTKALLACVGIESHYALIRAGYRARPMVTDFPSRQFNHVILCVPNRGDTVWLECTDQQQPFGYLGLFTDDRGALLITESGGQVARTPAYPAEANLERYAGTLTLQANGAAQGDLRGDYRGLMYDWGLTPLLRRKAAEQRAWLVDRLAWPTWQLGAVDLAVVPGELPGGALRFEAQISALATRSGNRLFWTPNLREPFTVPTPDPARTQPVVQRRGYQDVDSLAVQLPEGFSVEYLPEPVEIESPFGRYLMQVRESAGEVIYQRELLLRAGTYPATRYADWVAFWQAISEADRAQVVLVNRS